MRLLPIGASWARWQANRNCAAVVKADAYGLGAERVGAALYKAGCRDFFTATITEGVIMRRVAPEARIYIFNGFNIAAEKEYRQHGLTPVINSPTGIDNWLVKKRPGMRCALHLDTGINRLGLTSEQFADLTQDPARLAALDPELVISHFACAR